MTESRDDTPEAVLERLKALHPDPRRRRSLDVIDAVCRDQHEHSSHDYSLVTIGRLSTARRGPKRAALANPAGAPYRELIAAHKRCRTGSGKVASPTNGADAELLATLKSPLHRARLRAAWADAHRATEEAKHWRLKANALQAVAHASATLTLEPAAGAGELPGMHWGRRARLELLPIEQAALADALNPRRLVSVGLRVDARGRVLDTTGKAVFPIGFATMLTKVLAAAGKEVGDLEFGGVTDSSP